MQTTVECSYSNSLVSRELNSWVTTLRQPIHVEPGDIIKLDLAVVSTAGGGSDLIEFTTANNTTTMRLAFWIRDTGKQSQTGGTGSGDRCFVCETGTSNLVTQDITVTIPPGFYSVSDVAAIVTEQWRTPGQIPGLSAPYHTYSSGEVPPLDPNLGDDSAPGAGLNSPFAVYSSLFLGNSTCRGDVISGNGFETSSPGNPSLGQWAGSFEPELVWDAERSRFSVQGLHMPFINQGVDEEDEGDFGQDAVGSISTSAEAYFSVAGVHILSWHMDDPVGEAFWAKLGFLPSQVTTQDKAGFQFFVSADRETDVLQPSVLHLGAYLNISTGGARTLAYDQYTQNLAQMDADLRKLILTGTYGSTSIRAIALPLLSSAPFYRILTDLPISATNSYVGADGNLLSSLGVVSKAYTTGNFAYEVSERVFVVSEAKTISSILMELKNPDGTPATNLNLFSSVIITFQKQSGQESS